jgi:hypothetical protein
MKPVPADGAQRPVPGAGYCGDGLAVVALLRERRYEDFAATDR